MFNFTSGATSGAERAASPVVAEIFLSPGAQNPSTSPVKEVAPPVRGGGRVYCTLVHFFGYFEFFFLGGGGIKKNN